MRHFKIKLIVSKTLNITYEPPNTLYDINIEVVFCSVVLCLLKLQDKNNSTNNPEPVLASLLACLATIFFIQSINLTDR